MTSESSRAVSEQRLAASTPAVYLTDFGLAKNVSTGSRHTRTGQTLGTPAYMSPELARGEFRALTPASDVFALGALLYELLAGGPAFGVAVVSRHFTGPQSRSATSAHRTGETGAAYHWASSKGPRFATGF